MITGTAGATGPVLRVEETGASFTLTKDLTTVGRGEGVDIALHDLSVSRLHAEINRRGPHVYVSDLGLSANGTRVNGRPVGRRILFDGDIVSFGTARTRIGGLSLAGSLDDAISMSLSKTAHLTRRELDVLAALCRPALQQDAFVAPASTNDIAEELVVTEAAVKQHLLRLYQKFHIEEGTNRRARLANEVISAGIVHPVPIMLEEGVRA